jgi:hypothetical protein
MHRLQRLSQLLCRLPSGYTNVQGAVLPYAHKLQPYVSPNVHDKHLRPQVAPALAAGCTTVIQVVLRGLLLVAIRPFLPL